MHNVSSNSNHNNYLSIQNTEFDTTTDAKLPNELLVKVFSLLSYKEITSTCCVIKQWNIISIDVAKRHINECFTPYILFIMKNLEAAQYPGTMKRVGNLLETLSLNAEEINLQKIKTILICKKVVLSTELRHLGIQKLNTLKNSSENVKTPYFFHDMFDKAIEAINLGPNMDRGLRVHTERPIDRNR